MEFQKVQIPLDSHFISETDYYYYRPGVANLQLLSHMWLFAWCHAALLLILKSGFLIYVFFI